MARAFATIDALMRDAVKRAGQNGTGPLLELAAAAKVANAELIVGERYDRGRRAGYLDLGAGRRDRELMRLAERAADLERLAGRECDADADAIAAAWRRLIDRRLAGARRSPSSAPSVRNALRRAAGYLEADYPELEEYDPTVVLAEAGIHASELETTRRRSRAGGQVTA